jgi:hypothetical protein
MMKKKYKRLLLLSNLCLFFFVFNKLAGIILFENSNINFIFILLFCVSNVVIALVTIVDSVESK